jgi:hypothetical protein
MNWRRILILLDALETIVVCGREIDIPLAELNELTKAEFPEALTALHLAACERLYGPVYGLAAVSWFSASLAQTLEKADIVEIYAENWKRWR